MDRFVQDGRLAILLGVLITLVSCSSMPPATQPLDVSWKQRQTMLKNMQTWSLQGQMAVHTPGESGSASIDWKQSAQQYLISLMGPMGSYAIRITGKPGLVTLQNAQGLTFTASNPEQLLYNQMGWQLPVSSLVYWTRGLPVPTLPSQSQFDAHHRLTQLTQQDWQISFKQYTVFGQLELPTKIVMIHPQMNIKMVIYRWNH